MPMFEAFLVKRQCRSNQNINPKIGKHRERCKDNKIRLRVEGYDEGNEAIPRNSGTQPFILETVTRPGRIAISFAHKQQDVGNIDTSASRNFLPVHLGRNSNLDTERRMGDIAQWERLYCRKPCPHAGWVYIG